MRFSPKFQLMGWRYLFQSLRCLPGQFQWLLQALSVTFHTVPELLLRQRRMSFRHPQRRGSRPGSSESCIPRPVDHSRRCTPWMASHRQSLDLLYLLGVPVCCNHNLLVLVRINYELEVHRLPPCILNITHLPAPVLRFHVNGRNPAAIGRGDHKNMEDVGGEVVNFTNLGEKKNRVNFALVSSLYEQRNCVDLARVLQLCECPARTLKNETRRF